MFFSPGGLDKLSKRTRTSGSPRRTRSRKSNKRRRSFCKFHFSLRLPFSLLTGRPALLRPRGRRHRRRRTSKIKKLVNMTEWEWVAFLSGDDSDNPQAVWIHDGGSEWHTDTRCHTLPEKPHVRLGALRWEKKKRKKKKCGSWVRTTKAVLPLPRKSLRQQL